MSWRVVLVNSICKLSYKNDYLYVKGEEVKTIHLSEIGVLIIGSTQVNMTGIILAELIRRKVKVIFCDEKHNPYAEMTPYYGCHNSSRKLEMQINWDKQMQSFVADAIIEQKIINQASLLKKYDKQKEADMLNAYAEDISPNDATNREGHAAKVYFNALFGNQFTRNMASNINAKLDYGYAIFLSLINREVVCNGCLTQLGLRHHNEFNQFNLSCDFLEPWRVIVDEFVYCNAEDAFDSIYKGKLVNLLNKQVSFGYEYYLSNAIKNYVKSIIDGLNQNDIRLIKMYQFI